MTERPRVGLLGLGVMGSPMARNLLRAGYPLVVYNRSPGPAAELVAAGATAEATPAAVGARVDVAITMLANTDAVEQVVLGVGGMAEGLAPGSVHVDMSSISPLMARRVAAHLAERGVEALDAPVSGGEVGAREATLAIMVGGPAATLERVRPVLEVLGRGIVHIGEAGAGQVAKACNQLVVGVTIDAVAEALLLASAAGVDAARVRAALLGGFASSRILDVHGQRMLDHAFAPGFASAMQLKDLNIVAELGAACNLSLPGASTARDLYQALCDAGEGGLDHSGLLTLLERRAGQSIQPPDR
jgi:2-hydroxy-3-oxopropionate reductase